MSGNKTDLINYRIERADMTLETARRLIEGQDWFGTANRLYYAVYQIVSALMAQEGIRIQSHSGAKAMFELHFIKTGKVDRRENCTYGYQMHGTRVIMPLFLISSRKTSCLLPQTEEFIGVIKRLINT